MTTYLAIFGPPHFQVHQSANKLPGDNPRWSVHNGRGDMVATCPNKDAAELIAAWATNAIAKESE